MLVFASYQQCLVWGRIMQEVRVNSIDIHKEVKAD